MSDDWTGVISPGQTGLYGTSIYGNLYYGSSDWTVETETTDTWTDQSLGSTTWTEA
jgi:hypothetical protein